MGEISVKTGNNARNGGKNSLNRLIRCVCGKKIGPDPRNFNQRVNLGRNDLLIRTFPNSQHIKHIINQHPNTLFIVFMAIANVHFDEYLLVRKNLLISSKSIKPESLDDILGDILKKETTITSFLNMPTLSLSRTESSMLRMWMAGQGTIQISDQMNIKAKTVSSHKGNIKRKIKTHNKQVIYHVVRLTDNVTNGIFVNMR
ncbi:transcriptional regulator RcsA [Escherichia coli]